MVELPLATSLKWRSAWVGIALIRLDFGAFEVRLDAGTTQESARENAIERRVTFGPMSRVTSFDDVVAFTYTHLGDYRNTVPEPVYGWLKDVKEFFDDVDD